MDRFLPHMTRRRLPLFHLKRIVCAVVACATILQAQTPQTPVIPSGVVYQVALQNGIRYISPSSGEAILTKRAKLDWRTIVAHMAIDGSIDVLGAGIFRVIKMSVPIQEGLVVGHVFADKEITPLLATAAPNPNALPPVLQMNSVMAPTPTTCAENSIYAVYQYKAPTPTLTTVIAGATVTFSPQGPGVLRNSSGGLIPSLQIIDVLACLPVPASTITPAPAPTHAELRPPPEESDPFDPYGCNDDREALAWFTTIALNSYRAGGNL